MKLGKQLMKNKMDGLKAFTNLSKYNTESMTEQKRRVKNGDGPVNNPSMIYGTVLSTEGLRHQHQHQGCVRL